MAAPRSLIIAFPFLLLVIPPADSAEIKGLRLGEIYSHISLADIFGNAQCPTQEQISNLPAQWDSFTCKVPISYLGLSTSAEVHLSRNWQATSLWIDLSYSRFNDIEELLTVKYGEPSLRQGDFEKMVPGLNGGLEQRLYARCTTWPNANGASVRLCKEGIFPSSENGPYIIYGISNLIPLDPSDV